MFMTQIYGTVLGGFINYAVMISIVSGNKELLADTNGDASWSGATIQSYNTNASTWALAGYLYKQGQTYSIVPYGLAIGAAIVIAHRITVIVRSLSPPCPSPANSHILVGPQNRQLLAPRDQLPAIHSIRRLHPLQPVANVRAPQLGHCRLLHAVLPAQLPPAHLQGLLVPHCWRVRWRESDVLVYSVVCGFWSGRASDSVSPMVGE
jgi:hypothetical protein